MECGSLLPLLALLLAGALGAGSELPVQKAGASSRTHYEGVPLVVLGLVPAKWNENLNQGGAPHDVG
jgi:hypothetical protein